MHGGPKIRGTIRPSSQRQRPIQPRSGLRELALVHVEKGDRSRQRDRLDDLIERGRRFQMELIVLGSQGGNSAATPTPDRLAQILQRAGVVDRAREREGRGEDVSIEIAPVDENLGRCPWGIGIGKSLQVGLRRRRQGIRIVINAPGCLPPRIQTGEPSDHRQCNCDAASSHENDPNRRAHRHPPFEEEYRGWSGSKRERTRSFPFGTVCRPDSPAPFLNSYGVNLRQRIREWPGIPVRRRASFVTR